MKQRRMLPSAVTTSALAAAPLDQEQDQGNAANIQDTAVEGFQGGGQSLPFLDRISALFGGHDISDARAHTGEQAKDAASSMGARAYAAGNDVAFARTPDLHTAAHEAAHVVQQRNGASVPGGVGASGDAFERQADLVADRVVQGKDASDLLGPVGNSGAPSWAVQMDEDDEMCWDSAAVPEVTSPRGDMGQSDQEGGFESWVQPEFVSDPLIRQADGGERTQYDWSGPGACTGEDVRGYNADQDSLLGYEVDNGATSTYVPETHHELMRRDVPPEARASLDELGQDVHDPYTLGTGSYNIDEYSMVMDQLPEGYASKEEFLAQFLRSPNDMAGHIDDDGWDFDTFNEFSLKGAGTNEPWVDDGSGAPGVGDWYHIDIPMNDGDVMIVDTDQEEERSSATVQTMTDQEGGPANDNHPVSGRRQFGMEQLEDGRYRFYTRGFDRQSTDLQDMQVANQTQHQDWSTLMENMADQYGGTAERTDAEGNPVWGWARQVPGEVMTSCMENPVALPEDETYTLEYDPFHRYSTGAGGGPTTATGGGGGAGGAAGY